jgi:hypothetical protein
MNWPLFAKDVMIPPTLIVLVLGWILYFLLVRILGKIPTLQGYMIFWSGVTADVLKAWFLLTLLATKRITMSTFFWLDNATALMIVVGGWFLFRAHFTNRTWPTALYILSWLVVIALIGTALKQPPDQIKSFDIMHGAPQWMKAKYK